MAALDEMSLRLHSLVIFHNLPGDRVIAKLHALLASENKPPAEQIACYSAFVSGLFQENTNLTEYILDRVLEDENVYAVKRANNQPIDGMLEECLENELRILEDLSQISASEIKGRLAYEGYLPAWQTSSIDYLSAYRDRMAHIHTRGYGIYCKYHMFMIQDGGIVPVKCPDPVRLSDLKGYERERQAAVDNTLALLKGKPAANVLLYGDAGTGKSSTVKAIVNEYHSEGLRLIEVTKKQFCDMPGIMEKLVENPLKFILFIDDLSFEEAQDEFSALKAVLEGSVTAKAQNAVIYATSNRRHLVREMFSDRSGDDIHSNETIQEQRSLSERFGLSVSFFKPDKEQYLQIIHALQEPYGLQMDEQKLDLAAERYALQRGGRSPRVARQFMEYLKSKEN